LRTVKAPVHLLPIAAALAIVMGVTAACAPTGSGPTYAVQGRARAGPTCPVEPASPQPGQCDERPVTGAVLVIADASGHEVARLTTGAGGSFSTRLAVGRYTLTPQPVEGLVGGAPPIDFAVSDSSASRQLDVEYDTGIL